MIDNHTNTFNLVNKFNNIFNIYVSFQTSINNCLNIDPMDFEKFVTDKKTILQNDPLREILLYPHDDVSV